MFNVIHSIETFLTLIHIQVSAFNHGDDEKVFFFWLSVLLISFVSQHQMGLFAQTPTLIEGAKGKGDS